MKTRFDAIAERMPREHRGLLPCARFSPAALTLPTG